MWRSLQYLTILVQQLLENVLTSLTFQWYALLDNIFAIYSKYLLIKSKWAISTMVNMELTIVVMRGSNLRITFYMTVSYFVPLLVFLINLN